MKESFAEEIDLQIEKINKTNIGNQETKIIVYENSGKTIRTAIQGKDYEINFDYINTQDEKNIELIVKKDEIETYNIKLKKGDYVIIRKADVENFLIYTNVTIEDGLLKNIVATHFM